MPSFRYSDLDHLRGLQDGEALSKLQEVFGLAISQQKVIHLRNIGTVLYRKGRHQVNYSSNKKKLFHIVLVRPI